MVNVRVDGCTGAVEEGFEVFAEVETRLVTACTRPGLHFGEAMRKEVVSAGLK